MTYNKIISEGFSELIEYLDYLDEKFKKVENYFDNLKSGFNILQMSVDSSTYKLNKFFEELVM